jgi:hypothetical protein
MANSNDLSSYRLINLIWLSLNTIIIVFGVNLKYFKVDIYPFNVHGYTLFIMVSSNPSFFVI